MVDIFQRLQSLKRGSDLGREPLDLGDEDDDNPPLLDERDFRAGWRSKIFGALPHLHCMDVLIKQVHFLSFSLTALSSGHNTFRSIGTGRTATLMPFSPPSFD
jgi:hypothetical protein